MYKKQHTHCFVCKKPLPKRKRKLCGDAACVRALNNEWQREKRDKKRKVGVKCAICGRMYDKVGGHVRQMHDITAREYKEQFGLPVKRGILTDTSRELIARRFEENKEKVLPNLLKGKKYRFVKGGERQKGRYGWKSSGGAVEKLKDSDIYN